MMNEKIGIIVPVYKTEKYVAECIESILAQTYTNFRLILVDDGTPDNAGKICDEFAKKDSRITVIHQENAGVTRARARGVEEASDCEWITFVDSDDTILANSLKILLSYINNDIEIIVGEWIGSKDQTIKQKFNRCEYISKLIHSGVPQAPWGKLIRKNLFVKDVFDIPRNIIVGEDAIMNIRLAVRTTKKIMYTDDRIYKYRILEESTTHSFENSLAYQTEFFNILEQSLPKDLYKQVLPYIVLRALDNWKVFYRYSTKRINKEDIDFINKIKKYIWQSGYKLDIYDKIQLFCRIRLFRFLAVNIHKINNILR